MLDDGRVYGKGRNELGQLGLGRDVDRVEAFVPITALDREVIIQIAQGSGFSLFLTSTCQVYVAGSYSGDVANSVFTPQRVSGLGDVVIESIAAAGRVAFALSCNNSLHI